MIKIQTLGMLDSAKVNPVLTSEKDVENYQFITVDGDVYLISNTLTGDDAFVEDVVIKAGEYLNGFLVKAWEGQNLVIDDKHIVYAEDKAYTDISVGDILAINAEGKLEVTTEIPVGACFKVEGKCMLTGKAVTAKVIIGNSSADTGAGDSGENA